MNNKGKIVYLSKLIIPLIVVIALFVSAVNFGIITFQKPENKFNAQEIGANESATIIIDFGGGSDISFVINTVNITVYDFLFKAAKIGNFTVKSTYWQQFDSYIVDSITYNGVKYEADSSNYWAYYLNGNYGTVAADKQNVRNNDTIEWKFEKF